MINLDNGLAPNGQPAIIWTNADPIRWRIYAALSGDELDKISNRILFMKCGFSFIEMILLYFILEIS